jgi:hypothetical protein
MGNSFVDSKTVSDDAKEMKKHIIQTSTQNSNLPSDIYNNSLCVINNSHKMISGFSGSCAPRAVFPSFFSSF